MSDPAPPTGSAANRWLSPQDWSLRVKLAIALLVPSLIALVLGGLRVADQAGEAAAFDRIAQVAGAQGEVAELVERLQEERLRTTEFIVAGRTGDTAALQSSFAEVDAQQAAIRPIVQAFYAEDASVVGAHRQAEQALALLPQLRDLVLRSDSPAATAVARYSEVIDQILPLDGALLRGVNSPEVNGLANALAGLASARNESTLQQAMIAAATSAREPNGAELAGLPASEARLVTSLNNYRTALDTGQRVRFAEMIAGPANSDRSRLVTELTAADPARALPGGTGVRASKVYGDFLAEMDAAETGIRTELAATTEAARTTAVNLAVLNLVVLLAALVIGAIIVGLIARAIISSLRTLRGSALEVAQKSLPDAVARMRGGTVPDVNVTPVPVHTREEVGEVARAFDAVHAQAVRLAAEQATLQNTVNSMFVNLSRRSQSLVDRQLQLIEELESNEQDPDQLASLFRLDHLATRMRRNSENLLVLAGTDLAKRSAHLVPVVDVLQAAVSEVEQYERVTVEQPPVVTVLGRAANDLQHLLSELLDNATSFSPPETQVTMSTSRAGTGPLVVEIIDRGIGMRPDELEDINKRFADADDSRMTASRRMGLFVVGRLAARHGVQVRLIAGAPTPDPAAAETGPLVTAKGTGVTARVTIPAHLVASGTGSPGRRPEQSKAATALARPAGGPPSILVPPQRSGELPGAGPVANGRSGTAARPALNGTGPVAEPPVPTVTPLPVVPGPPLAKRTPRQPGEPPAARSAAPEDATPEHGERPVNGVAPATDTTPARGGATPLWPVDTGLGAAGPAPDPAAIAAPELFGPSPVLDPDDTPTTRTPIFEEVASGWFRAYRQVPINWQPDIDGVVPDQIDRSQPVRPSAAAAAVAAEPDVPEPPRPSVRPGPVPDDFASAADDGWRAAVVARREAAPAETVPGTDLPRRTPGAQLLPGGIAATGPTAPVASGSSRDAAAIRSRLSNYQRGVRTGRSERDKVEPVGGEADGSTASRSTGSDPVGTGAGTSSGSGSSGSGSSGSGSSGSGPSGSGSSGSGLSGNGPSGSGSSGSAGSGSFESRSSDFGSGAGGGSGVPDRSAGSPVAGRSRSDRRPGAGPGNSGSEVGGAGALGGSAGAGGGTTGETGPARSVERTAGRAGSEVSRSGDPAGTAPDSGASPTAAGAPRRSAALASGDHFGAARSTRAGAGSDASAASPGPRGGVAGAVPTVGSGRGGRVPDGSGPTGRAPSRGLGSDSPRGSGAGNGVSGEAAPGGAGAGPAGGSGVENGLSGGSGVGRGGSRGGFGSDPLGVGNGVSGGAARGAAGSGLADGSSTSSGPGSSGGMGPGPTGAAGSARAGSAGDRLAGRAPDAATGGSAAGSGEHRPSRGGGAGSGGAGSGAGGDSGGSDGFGSSGRSGARAPVESGAANDAAAAADARPGAARRGGVDPGDRTSSGNPPTEPPRRRGLTEPGSAPARQPAAGSRPAGKRAETERRSTSTGRHELIRRPAPQSEPASDGAPTDTTTPDTTTPDTPRPNPAEPGPPNNS